MGADMATVGVIQARLSSRRFPRKALADLLGHPVIWWVCTRVREVEGLDRVILACPPADREAFTALNLPCEVLAPDVPEDDVLARFAAVAELLGLNDDDLILRVTGDCPAWNPTVGAGVIRQAYLCNDERYARLVTADTTCSGWPDGWDAEAFTAAMLRDADRHDTWALDREHPTRSMRREYDIQVFVNPHGDFGHLKLSIDTPEDLTRVREYLQRYTVGGAHVDAS